MRIPQVNFSKGELAPELYGRFDVDAWQSALRQARNVIVMKYGGVTKRPGTRLVGTVINAGQPTRLVPFQFSMTQTYVLEMGQGYMAPCALGGRILEGEQPITAITNAANARLTIAFHGFAVGDLIYIDGVADGMGAVLNYRTWSVTAVIDANTLTINADTTTCPAFSGCTGGTANTSPPIVVPPPAVPPPSSTTLAPTVSYGGGLGSNRQKD
ncbi:hypothetical protein [Novosphingobium sp. Fuku2-ISO-50]|uniref:hypothetical protein n=1 Tax=Novosphingobium sp. Fuku2-ISO-50 TaxID=1739114 RepID=UPI00076C8F94|nr:hypothetical protein [Novosphingobium sp. Fuku2-ISO-50]KUR73333.1 hypothetical protein AQZ50_19235 [Novosphingobium sp. Fuku2-ISO-50]